MFYGRALDYPLIGRSEHPVGQSLMQKRRENGAKESLRI